MRCSNTSTKPGFGTSLSLAVTRWSYHAVSVTDEIAFNKGRPEKVERLELHREKGFRYLLGPDLEVVRIPLDLDDPTPTYVIARPEHERRAGFFYFIDVDGDIARLPEQIEERKS
jgi:hypothetical protein